MDSTLHSIFEQRHNGDQTAIIIPRSCPVPCTLSYKELYKVIQGICNILNCLKIALKIEKK